MGVLLKVHHAPTNPRRIFLTMEHEGIEYTGCLLMEYDFSCTVMVRLLEECMGMSIETIGNLEVPLAFETTATHTYTQEK